MAENWPYAFAPPPVAAPQQAQQPAPQPYYYPPPQAPPPQAPPPQTAAPAEPASIPDMVCCDHCGDVIDEEESCFIITQATVKRSQKSGRLVALEDTVTSPDPNYYLHEYCIQEFVMGEYCGDILCAACDAKLNGDG